MQSDRSLLQDCEDTAPPSHVAAHPSLAELRPRTLKHDDTFALFNHHGDLSARPGSPEGLYHEDMRFLSGLRLRIAGKMPLLLSSTVQSNNAVLDVDLTNPDIFAGDRLVLPKDTIHISRMKFLWKAACYDVISVRNFGNQVERVTVALDFDADFADLFEIRGFVRHARGRIDTHVSEQDTVRFDYHSLDGVARSTVICFEPRPTRLTERTAEFELQLAPRQRRTILVTVHCRVNDRPIERRLIVAARASRRTLREAARRAAAIETSNTLANEVICRSMADISMLVTSTEHGPYPYAGVPWFSTAFGRDGLLTALELLWVDPSLARGVLRFLAAHQATSEDPERDAEPGKILHEARKGELARLGVVPFDRYYGSIDSTPLFVVLAGLYWQYTGDRTTLETIWPNVKAALAWIDQYGDYDGDGFVEYRRRSEGGLVNQGWKDSGDAVFHEDGTLAEGPIALCEVQGYVYLARKLAARMARAVGEQELASKLRRQAHEIRERFERAFWDDELGMYVLALDGAKRPCRVRTSNAGHVLFTGIASSARAARVAKRLMSREFFTGWGIRTVGTQEARYNPTSYHNGSVWPHDNALIALGLAKYGHSRPVARIMTALFDAAAHMDLRRLPELFCGMPRRRDKGPILYPVACVPQAWAAAAPLALLQACLGLEIDASARVLRLRHPYLPELLESVRIDGLQVGASRLDLLFRRHGEDVAVNVLHREGNAEVEVRL
ncbi:MAG: amylo-alpha-1,6-glucosidase [Gammaproteobacteria bacterium]|nr:amylo-alpha-1,6-glucosidase [Gammaproteobacteria bacterium]